MKQSTLADIPLEAGVATPPMRLTKPRAATLALFVFATASCGFPRPPDVVGGDASVGSDGSAGPLVAIHVAPSGDDANDGLTLPVKTLKHAIDLAAANPQITQIALTAGTYSGANGETFPYIIPANITVVGPASGGAILAGNKTVPGLTVDVGGLQDLSLQDFATAVTVTGTANLKNVKILTSMIAVQIEATGSLTINNLDATGIAPAGDGQCSTGIVLNGAAKLVATTLTEHGLAPALDARDQSVVAIADATIASPGSNVFQRNTIVSVFAESPALVNAVGNTWNPNVQGADGNGKYTTTATISGPVTAPTNGNYQINAGSSVSR